MHNARTPSRDFNEFDDPLAKILLGIGIVLTAMFVSLCFSISLVGMEFLGLLISVSWLLRVRGRRRYLRVNSQHPVWKGEQETQRVNAV
jgi:hypothetical protein